MDYPVVRVKAVKQKFKMVEYSNAELLNIVFDIAETVRDEGETLEESLFQSSNHIIEQCFSLGANTYFVGHAVFQYYKDTPYKLAAAVFRDYCIYSNDQIVSSGLRSFFDGVNKRYKGRVMSAKSNEESIKRGEEIKADWDKWQVDKSLYKNQAEFIRAMTSKYMLSDRSVKKWVARVDAK